MVGSSKRSHKEQLREGKPSKRRKFALIEQGWGTKTTVLGARSKTFLEEQTDSKEEEQESKREAGEQPTSEEQEEVQS